MNKALAVIEEQIAKYELLATQKTKKQSEYLEVAEQLRNVVKNCNLHVVSNNEVAVCDHPDEAIIMDGDMDYCMACSTRIPKQTDC